MHSEHRSSRYRLQIGSGNVETIEGESDGNSSNQIIKPGGLGGLLAWAIEITLLEVNFTLVLQPSTLARLG